MISHQQLTEEQEQLISTFVTEAEVCEYLARCGDYNTEAFKVHQELDNQQREISLSSHRLCIQDHHKALSKYSASESYNHLKYGLSANGFLYQLYSLMHGRKDSTLRISYQQFHGSHLYEPRTYLLLVLDKHQCLRYNYFGANNAPSIKRSILKCCRIHCGEWTKHSRLSFVE